VLLVPDPSIIRRSPRYLVKRGRCVLPAAVFRRVGGVWCELDSEVDVDGGGDPLAQESGRGGSQNRGAKVGAIVRSR
jgi:hypothetical protein